MQISIQEALEVRFKNFQENPENVLRIKGTEYQKEWAKGVQYFQTRVNQDRIKEKKLPLAFIAIRQKLEGVKEIDDLRWFYGQCIKYKYKKKGNTFSKCFFGALKLK